MLKKSYVDTSGGQIHYCRSDGGSGSPLVFFHMTAASLNSYIPLMRELEGKQPTLALDTVNYGESFRTTRPPSIRYIAEILLEALDNLGIKQFHAFGHHTGASIAVEIATIVPDRVLSVIANGPNYTTDEENRRAFDRLAVPNPITMKGTQFIWAWSRIKDNYPVPLWNGSPKQAEVMNRDTVDMLRAGENWDWAYRAVFTHDLPAAMAVVRCPIFLVCGALDLVMRIHDRATQALPDARSLVIADSGVYMIETHSEELAPYLIDFVQSAAVGNINRR